MSSSAPAGPPAAWSRFIAHYYAVPDHSVCSTAIGGLLALVSAMFTVSWIQRHNEMTALMAAGVSRIRVLLPIIVAVAVVSLILAANREILIPRYRHELSRRPQGSVGLQAAVAAGRATTAGPTFCWAASNSFADEQRIEEPHFRHAAELCPPTAVDLTADNAYYKPPANAQGDRPGGYLFEGVHRPKNLDSRPSLLAGRAARCSSRRTTPRWLKPNQCFVVSDVDFDQLTCEKSIDATVVDG